MPVEAVRQAQGGGAGFAGVRAVDDAVALGAGETGFVAGAGAFVEGLSGVVFEWRGEFVEDGGSEDCAGDGCVVPGVDEPDGAAGLAEFLFDGTEVGAGA